MFLLMRPKALLGASIAAVLVLLLVTSCGLKGPLYRSDEPQDQAVTPTDEAAAAAKKKQNESPVQPPDPDRPAVPPQN
jgi:predicted small lipoprotein YifL